MNIYVLFLNKFKNQNNKNESKDNFRSRAGNKKETKT